MTLATTGRFPTDRPERYLKQLASHLGRKLEVDSEGDAAAIRLGEASARLTPVPGSLEVAVASPADADAHRLMGVIASHLERFAKEEGTFVWDDAALAEASRAARAAFLAQRQAEAEAASEAERQGE